MPWAFLRHRRCASGKPQKKVLQIFPKGQPYWPKIPSPTCRRCLWITKSGTAMTQRMRPALSPSKIELDRIPTDP